MLAVALEAIGAGLVEQAAGRPAAQGFRQHGLPSHIPEGMGLGVLGPRIEIGIRGVAVHERPARRHLALGEGGADEAGQKGGGDQNAATLREHCRHDPDKRTFVTVRARPPIGGFARRQSPRRLRPKPERRPESERRPSRERRDRPGAHASGRTDARRRDGDRPRRRRSSEVGFEFRGAWSCGSQPVSVEVRHGLSSDLSRFLGNRQALTSTRARPACALGSCALAVSSPSPSGGEMAPSSLLRDRFTWCRPIATKLVFILQRSSIF